MRVPLKATVVTPKGRVYDTTGHLWGEDGLVFLRNPRPERYPDRDGLVGTRGELRLSWAAPGDEIAPGDPSIFSIRSLLVDPKPPKPKRRKTKKRSTTS